jgi:hypothetical protein
MNTDLGQRPVLDPAQEESHQRPLEARSQLATQLLNRRFVGGGGHRFESIPWHVSTRQMGIEALKEMPDRGVLLN